MLNRRNFCRQSGTALAAAVIASTNRSGRKPVALSKMGIASTSFMGADIGGRAPANNAAPPATPAPRPRQRDALEFLEKCHALGAGGAQMALNGDLEKLRARAETLGMYIEGMVAIPRGDDLSALEQSLANAKQAGARVVRAAMLSGRRYETFTSLKDWQAWVAQSHAALQRALPVIEKHKVIVALENHKDWTLEEFLQLLKKYQSEYLQVCLDFGNNLSLLDEPMELIEGLAPYAKSTHIKDMAVQPYADGFLLSEVPLGAGLLPLRRIVEVIQKANPQTKFSLEMITRDPLQVPCLTPAYWQVFPERNGKYLAQIFKLVQAKAWQQPLPTVTQLAPEARAKAEEDNVKQCLRYVEETKLLG